MNVVAERTVLIVFQIATRKAYGLALTKLGRPNERVVVMDADTKNSTFAEMFKNEFPNRYVECYIAEQNMVRYYIAFIWNTVNYSRKEMYCIRLFPQAIKKL